MDKESGHIYKDFESARLEKDAKEENLVPFEYMEVVKIKDCYFEIIAIAPAPADIIVLEAIEREEGERRYKRQSNERD